MRSSVSFGTSCMGRLHHIQETYIKNIQTVLDVDINSKFVLLNYNSQDSMHDWVQTNLKEYMSNGIVKYIRTTKPQVFSQSHTKNITARHAETDIVCNLDADNLLTSLYVEQLLDYFNGDNQSHKISKPRANGGYAGRIACYKKDLIEIGGFDESMTGWGVEDDDFLTRFKMYFYPCDLMVPDISPEEVIIHPKNHKQNLESRKVNTKIHKKTICEFNKSRDRTMLIVNRGISWGKI